MVKADRSDRLPEPHLAIPSLLAEGAATSTAMRLAGNTVARVPCRCSAVCDTIFSSVQVFLA
jgi:hypothetical protein